MLELVKKLNKPYSFTATTPQPRRSTVSATLPLPYMQITSTPPAIAS